MITSVALLYHTRTKTNQCLAGEMNDNDQCFSSAVDSACAMVLWNVVAPLSYRGRLVHAAKFQEIRLSPDAWRPGSQRRGSGQVAAVHRRVVLGISVRGQRHSCPEVPLTDVPSSDPIWSLCGQLQQSGQRRERQLLKSVRFPEMRNGC